MVAMKSCLGLCMSFLECVTMREGRGGLGATSFLVAKLEEKPWVEVPHHVKVVQGNTRR